MEMGRVSDSWEFSMCGTANHSTRWSNDRMLDITTNQLNQAQVLLSLLNHLPLRSPDTLLFYFLLTTSCVHKPKPWREKDDIIVDG